MNIDPRALPDTADVMYCFGRRPIICQECGHGIDPHGADPGGPCGVGGCPCLMQPNGIACQIVSGFEAQLKDVAALHQQDGMQGAPRDFPGWCVTCDEEWPCDTAKALGVAE